MATKRRTKNLEDMTVDEMLAYTRATEQSAELLDALLETPDSRRETLKMLKIRRPDMTIPEIDNAAEVERLVAAESEERKKLEQRFRESEIEKRVNAERERVKKAYDFSDADIVEVEKIMTDKEAPIPHYDAAAKVFKASRVQATPTSAAIVAARTFDMPGKDIWGKGVGNKVELNKIAEQQAVIALNEVRGAKAA